MVVALAGSVTVQPKGNVEVRTEVQDWMGPPGLMVGVRWVMIGPPGLVEGRRLEAAQAVTVVVPETVRVDWQSWEPCQ